MRNVKGPVREGNTSFHTPHFIFKLCTCSYHSSLRMTPSRSCLRVNAMCVQETFSPFWSQSARHAGCDDPAVRRLLGHQAQPAPSIGWSICKWQAGHDCQQIEPCSAEQLDQQPLAASQGKTPSADLCRMHPMLQHACCQGSPWTSACSCDLCMMAAAQHGNLLKGTTSIIKFSDVAPPGSRSEIYQFSASTALCHSHNLEANQRPRQGLRAFQ